MLRAIIIMKNYIQKSKYTTSYLPTTREKNTLEEATQPEEDVKEEHRERKAYIPGFRKTQVHIRGFLLPVLAIKMKYLFTGVR